MDILQWLNDHVVGLITGGLVTLIGLLIALLRERRDQGSKKTTHEKNRPRPRVDVTVVETDRATVKMVVVKIFSLGDLPLTVNYGEVVIQSSEYPQPVKSQQISRKEVIPSVPIKIELPVKLAVLHPSPLREATIKLTCQFSYGEDGQTYTEEQYYNPFTRQFENRQ